MNTVLNKYRLAVIGGGWSYERDSNIFSAQSVAHELKRHKVKYKYIEIKPNFSIIKQLKSLRVDFAFLTVTEEVPIQPILDSLKIKYNGSNNSTTALLFNKRFTNIILSNCGVRTPFAVYLSKRNYCEANVNFDFPVIVKPVSCGESCGVSLVKNKGQLQKAINLAFRFDREILIEKFINGLEITIPILGSFVMPAVKIISPISIWDYEHKDKLNVTMETIKKNKKLIEEINSMVKKITNNFDLKSFWRIDAIYKNNKLFLLEINTQPCLAKEGIISASCQELGWEYFDFLNKLLKESIKPSSHQ